jgi:hypothetical protein
MIEVMAGERSGEIMAIGVAICAAEAAKTPPGHSRRREAEMSWLRNYQRDPQMFTVATRRQYIDGYLCAYHALN